MIVKNSRAFTLIELLVVVLIIGILSAIALPQYTKSVKRARGAQAITMARSLADAANRYYLANGSYADISFSNLDIDVPSAINISGESWVPVIGVNDGQNLEVCVAKDGIQGWCWRGPGIMYLLKAGTIDYSACIQSVESEWKKGCKEYFNDSAYEAYYASGNKEAK